MFKRLSKLVCVLVLGVSFSINAYADDSSNIANIATNTANTAARLNTIINNYLADIKSDVAAIDTNVQNIKTAVANTITTSLNGISSTLTSIKGYVDGVEGYIDGVEGKLDNIYSALGTSNSNWVTLGNYIDAMYSTMQTTDSTNTDIYNLLNTYTNTYLASIDKTLAVISDNITVDRWSSTQNTITVTSPASNTYTYTLQSVSFPVVTLSTNAAGVPQLNVSTVQRYGNFHGIVRVLSNEFLQSILTRGINAVLGLQYIISQDTDYIGQELHLAYQLLDSFKSANHTDIINFASQNHTDIIAFKDANHTDLVTINTSINNFKASFDAWVLKWVHWAKQYYVIKDNLINTRRSTSPDVIQLTTFEGAATVSYELTGSEIYNIYYDQDSHRIRRETITRYANFRGSLLTNFTALNNGIWAICEYLNDNSVANSISNNVNALNTNLTQYQTAEQNLQNRVQSSISTFVPDLTLLSGFVALSWVSNYLQQMYVSLGAYGTVIMIGLLLAVCMQFIGYFRYKY